MKKTILIFSVDMVPVQNRYVSGGGLRAWSIGEGLKCKGHDVIHSVPRKLIEAEGISGELSTYAYQPENLNKIIRKVVPDIILFEQWGLVTYLEDTRIPVIIDLHGSLILENYYRQHRQFHYNAAAKIKTFGKADFFLCPSQRQKSYFLSWTMLSGFNLDRKHIGVVPVSLSPELPPKKVPNEPTFIFGGGLWPWIDPFPAMEILSDEIRSSGHGRLKLFSQKPELQRILPKDDIMGDNYTRLNRLEENNKLELLGFIPHDQLMHEYSNASVALDIYQWNEERELAFSTRTIEYLWSGLPVIHADYSDIAPFIRDYHAGWCLDPNDVEGVHKTIRDIFNNPETVQEYGKNAQSLVRDHFTWDHTIDPLNEFVLNPALKSKKLTLFDLSSMEFDRIEWELEAETKKLQESLAEKSAALNHSNKYYDNEIHQAQKTIEAQSNELQLLQQRLQEETKSHLFEIQRIQLSLGEELKNRDEELRRLKDENQKISTELIELHKTASDYKCHLDELAATIAEQNSNILKQRMISSDYQNQLNEIQKSSGQQSEEIVRLRHIIFLSTEQVTYLTGVLKSIQNRFFYKAYKLIIYRSKRLLLDYPKLFYLLAINLITNIYLNAISGQVKK